MSVFVDTPGLLDGPPSFLEVVVGGKCTDTAGDDRPALNIYNFVRISEGDTPLGPEVVANQFVNAWKDEFVELLHEDFVGVNSKCRYMDDPYSPVVEGTGPNTGAVTTSRGPLYTAATFTAVTDGRGKHFRSGKHFSPIAEADVDADQLTPDWLDRAETFRTALQTMISFTDTGGSVWQMIQLARSLCNFTARPCVFTGSFVKSFLINSTATTMRRRRQKNRIVV